MSKRHQASRRRTYGRRQHEIHQRPDLQPADRLLDTDGQGADRDRAGAFRVLERGPAPFAYGFAD